MPLVTTDVRDNLTVLQPYLRLGDPHACSDDRQRLSLLHALYEPLVKRAGNGHFSGALARTWTLSADACRWEFHLRQGVYFHDGTPLSADDVVASLTRVRDETIAGELGTTGIYQGYLQGCQLEAKDAHTVILTLPAPMADLLDVLVALFILPANSLAALPQLPPGTGPFRLIQQAADEVVMEAHQAYWQGSAAVKQVVWRAVAEAEVRLEHLSSGHADIASEVDHSPNTLTYHTRSSSVTTTFMFNLIAGNVADINLRRALNYATDKRAIVQTLFQGDAHSNNHSNAQSNNHSNAQINAHIMASPCTPPQLGYDPELAPYSYDPQQARRLLEASSSAHPTLTFDIPSRLPDEAKQLAALLQEQWQAVGVVLEVVEHQNRPQYATSVREKNIHDAACFDSSPHSTFRLFHEKFRSDTPGVWWLGYDNAAFNTLLGRAQTTTDIGQRQHLYRHAAKVLRDDPPWLYLYSANLRWAAHTRVNGWQPSVDGMVTFTPREGT
jgi:peptide/nickel transport system substrate-binding protein